MPIEETSRAQGRALALSNVAMRAFRSPVSGLATMLAALAGDTGAELISAHLIPPVKGPVELLATGGPSAPRLGPPGKVTPSIAAALATIATEAAVHSTSPLKEMAPWSDMPHVMSLAVLVDEDSCCIVTIASNEPIKGQDFYDACSPVGLLVQMIVDRRTIEGLRKTLHEQIQDRSLLNASLQHDLRTPLTGILGSARTLQRSWERLQAADREALLEGLAQQAERINRMVTDALGKEASSPG